ncbi:MAG: hypothetical protein ABSG15_12020, partial [FCB group bacterium]
QLLADSASKLTNYGIALIPDNSSTVIRTISGQEIGDTARLHASIRVYYRNPIYNNQPYTDFIVSTGDASMVNTSTAIDTHDLIIQGGVSYRNKMVFDLSMLPPLAAIHGAELDLTLNPAKSYAGNTSLDSIIYAVLLPSTEPYNSSKITGSYYGYRSSSTSNLYIFPNMISSIDYWTRYLNKGFLVFSAEGIINEYQELNRLVFYGNNEADSTKRPKLKIIYSTRPKLKSK